MLFEGASAPETELTGRIWRFGQFEFDEASRELRDKGVTVELESKPAEVLYALLLHAGEVVTKDELLDSVWPEVTVVEGSLPTAVSKLRKAIGGENLSLIQTVPRVGYRLGAPVQCRRAALAGVHELDFRPGSPVPGREQWLFVRKLDLTASSEVWLAENPKTHELRVFKFASDAVRLRALKREVTVARLLKESLGERPDFVRILEWNFETAPFYIESEFCGLNLAGWADAQGGLPAVSVSTRLRIVEEIARAVASAHELGIIHKDLKPANVLIATQADGSTQVKVADFGSGALVEPERLRALGITNIGFTQPLAAGADLLTGTLMYLPPEVLSGQVPTASADVYALGVLLYQVLAGDFRKPLSPGWESDISDPVLRQDIADAACGDPARRLTGVALLVERLESLERRRFERNELESARERAQFAERRLAAARARRPWVLAAVLILVCGFAASLFLYRRATHQTEIATAVNRFLGNDLLGRNDPFHSGGSEETLAGAVKQALPAIDRQFKTAPEVAAELHHTIARALDNRSDFGAARSEYERSTALYRQTEGPLSRDAIIAQLQRASMEARTYQKDAIALARSIVAAQEASIAKLSRPGDDLLVWLASARGMIALIENDAKLAASQFREAYERSAKLPAFDENARLTFKQRLAFASIRLGDGATAERLFRELIDSFSRLSGPDNPSVLRVRLNLAQAFMIQGKNREAIDEANRIYPEYVARLGESHELTMQLLTTRAQCEGALGLWDDAIRDDLAIYKLAMQKQGPTSFFAVATLSDAALAECRAGRYNEGEPNALSAWTASAKAFGPRAGLTGGTAYTLAACRIGQGKLAEASSLLRDIDTKAVAQLTGFPYWSANVDLARAEIEYRQGDVEAARRYLQSAAPVFSKADAEPFQKRALETLTAALGKVTVPVPRRN